MVSLPNYAGRSDADQALRDELQLAGITIEHLPEYMRNRNGEVKTTVIGSLHGWGFKRAWRYWMCDGPGIPLDAAMKLHADYGKEVRVAGHCGCPSPLEWFKGLGTGSYHVDTLRGLRALRDTICAVVQQSEVSGDTMQQAASSFVPAPGSARWKSKALWPDGETSSDEHDTEAQARAVCKILNRDGMGGLQEVFPTKTWVVAPNDKLKGGGSLRDLADKIIAWRSEAHAASHGEYGPTPQGEPIDYWRGRRNVLFELHAFLPDGYRDDRAF